MSCVLIVQITTSVLCVDSTSCTLLCTTNLLPCMHITTCVLCVDYTKHKLLFCLLMTQNDILLTYMLIVQITSCPVMIVTNVLCVHLCGVSNSWWLCSGVFDGWWLCSGVFDSWWLCLGIWQLVALQWGIRQLVALQRGIGQLFCTTGTCYSPCWWQVDLTTYKWGQSLLACVAPTVCHLNSPCSVQMKLHQQLSSVKFEIN